LNGEFASDPDYAMHIFLAIGQLAEAEAECIADFRSMASDIRSCRKELEENHDHVINYMGLIEAVAELRYKKRVADADAGLIAAAPELSTAAEDF
jgi:hypothetical protein